MVVHWDDDDEDYYKDFLRSRCICIDYPTNDSFGHIEVLEVLLADKYDCLYSDWFNMFF